MRFDRWAVVAFVGAFCIGYFGMKSLIALGVWCDRQSSKEHEEWRQWFEISVSEAVGDKLDARSAAEADNNKNGEA